MKYTTIFSLAITPLAYAQTQNSAPNPPDNQTTENDPTPTNDSTQIVGGDSTPSLFSKLEHELTRVKTDLGIEKKPTSMRQQMRAISSNDMRLLQNYGCWCNFDTYKKGQSHGKPVDFFDNACKVLKEGYECIEMDAATSQQDEDKVCDVQKTRYKSALGSGHPSQMTVEVLTNECDLVNETNCQKRLCKVEGWFIQSILKKTYSDGVFPDIFNYKHMYGAFDPQVECLKTTVTGSSELDCCGNYPRRFTFRHSGSNRSCCNGKTYNSIVLSCCDDGSTRPVCQ